MSKTLPQRIRRNRQQKAVLNALAKGAPIADALSYGNASWLDFRHAEATSRPNVQRDVSAMKGSACATRSCTQDRSTNGSLAGELLRDTLVKEAAEKVRKGDDDARKTLWAVRDPHFTLIQGLRLKQAQHRKALRLKEAERHAWGKQAVREAKAEIRQHEKLPRDMAGSRLPRLRDQRSRKRGSVGHPVLYPEPVTEFELGRAPSIGNSGSNDKPPPPSLT